MAEPTTPIYTELCRAFSERGAHHPETETVEPGDTAEEEEEAWQAERRPAS